MAQILVRLGPVVGDQRVLGVGRRRVLQAVYPDVLHPTEGTIVMLEGPSQPWSTAQRGLRVREVPEACVSLAVASGRPATRWARLPRASTAVVIDPDGWAAELVVGGPADAFTYLLNYAGWRLTDFPNRHIEVQEYSSSTGTLWVVLSEAVPRPDHDPRPFPPWEGPEWEPPPPVVPAPEPVRVHLSLSFVEVEFFDGGILFDHDGQSVSWADETCREVLNHLREELHQELPEGVQVEGAGQTDGSIIWDVRGLQGLHGRFRLRRFERLATAQRQRPTWLPAVTVLQRDDELEPDDLADLLDIPALGLDSRGDALRRLFRRRDRGVHVQVLWGRSLLLPFLAQDGGVRWWAWETAEDGNATYLFRPVDEHAFERLKEWTSGLARRYELLEGAELRAELGYVTKVIHHNGEDDPLGRWWAALCGRVGLPAEREDGEVW